MAKKKAKKKKAVKRKAAKKKKGAKKKQHPMFFRGVVWHPNFFGLIGRRFTEITDVIGL